MAVEHSKKYEDLKKRYEMNYITLDTLKGWVELNDRKPGRGITAEEFQEITGIPYEA